MAKKQYEKIFLRFSDCQLQLDFSTSSHDLGDGKWTENDQIMTKIW